MEALREMIRKELAKTLLSMTESSPSQVAINTNNDRILYNFEAGKAFGLNKLSRDIGGLGQYYMSSYFPNSEMKETWMFEIDASYGGSQVVEITHQLHTDYKSYWRLTISESQKGSGELQMIKSSGFIESYDKFISEINSKLEKMINPELL